MTDRVISAAVVHLCLECHKIILEAFVFLDIALYCLEIAAQLLRDARVLLLHARQRVLHVAVEPVQFAGTIELLITSLHLCQKTLPAVPTSSTTNCHQFFQNNKIISTTGLPTTSSINSHGRNHFN